MDDNHGDDVLSTNIFELIWSDRAIRMNNNKMWYGMDDVIVLVERGWYTPLILPWLPFSSTRLSGKKCNIQRKTIKINYKILVYKWRVLSLSPP